MKAVILAAGRGSRLGKYTDDRPKSLIEIGGKTLIERSIANLQKAGFHQVVVVVGYLEHKLREVITSKFDKSFCKIIFNPDYTRGSGSSLICAADEFTGDTVTVESDLLYHEEVVRRLGSPDIENALAMGHFNHGRREVKIFLKDGYIEAAKWEEPEAQADGDWVGITRFSTEVAATLRINLLSTDPNQGKEINYEDFIFPLMKQYRFQAVPIDDVPWIEIDNEEDLKRAETEVYPRMC